MIQRAQRRLSLNLDHIGRLDQMSEDSDGGQYESTVVLNGVTPDSS